MGRYLSKHTPKAVERLMAKAAMYRTVSWTDRLVHEGGRPMARALIRARHRYDKLKPAHIRASVLHTAYGRKSRR